MDTYSHEMCRLTLGKNWVQQRLETETVIYILFLSLGTLSFFGNILSWLIALFLSCPCTFFPLDEATISLYWLFSSRHFRYYFDQETGTCNCFLYGGCSEHGKPEGPANFITLEECLHECRPPKLEEGPYCKVVFKDENFQSFLQVGDTPSQAKPVDLSHLSDKKFIESFSR